MNKTAAWALIVIGRYLCPALLMASWLLQLIRWQQLQLFGLMPAGAPVAVPNTAMHFNCKGRMA